MEKAKVLIGISWYRPEEYEQMKSVLEPADSLPETYEEWLKGVQGMLAQLLVDGFQTRKVYLDPVNFPAWCKARGLAPTAETRALYTSEMVSAMPPKNSIL